MAHPKLASAVNRSVLAASTMVLMAGPLAVAGSAQTLDGVTDSTGQVIEDLTCEEAKKTEDDKLIAEFCPEDKDGKRKPASDPIDETKETVERTAKETKETVESTLRPDEPDDEPEDDDGGGGGGSQPTDAVVPPSGDSGGEKPGSSRVGKAGRENPRGIDGGRSAAAENPGGRPAQTAGYSSGGGYAGMRSHSELTLQPFAAPLVSVPPIYEFPQIAEQLFSDDAPAVAGDPQIAADGTTPTTAINAYNENGFAATSADPTGWLAATATGLIMLVGAGHALNGGRTPRRAEG